MLTPYQNKTQNIYRSVQIPSASQGEIYSIWHSFKGYQKAQKEENITRNEKNQIIKTNL